MSLEIEIHDGVYSIPVPNGRTIKIGEDGWTGSVILNGEILKKSQIGNTADVLYGGDMSGDSAGLGIPLKSSDGLNHFAEAVYADDAGVALTAGWVSGIFGSMVIYTAVTGPINLSAFGIAGQLHVGANVASIGNLAGVFGVAECDGTETIAANFFGVLAGVTLASGATVSSGYYFGGVIVVGSLQGTHTGKAVGLFIQNATGAKQFDAAFAFGQDGQMAGVVDAGAVSGSQSHKLKVYCGGTLFYIPLNTA